MNQIDQRNIWAFQRPGYPSQTLSINAQSFLLRRSKKSGAEMVRQVGLPLVSDGDATVMDSHLPDRVTGGVVSLLPQVGNEKAVKQPIRKPRRQRHAPDAQTLKTRQRARRAQHRFGVHESRNGISWQ